MELPVVTVLAQDAAQTPIGRDSRILAVVTVKAWLEGHQFDLEALVELLPTGDISVETDGNGGFYLTANEIYNSLAGVPFYEVAPVALQRINGLARSRARGTRRIVRYG